MRHLQNTIIVLAVTVLTATVIHTAVSAFAGTTASTLSSASGGAVQTCPRTGCTASSCHATSGRSRDALPL